MTSIITYYSTFLLGALHALEPGHGKSMLFTFALEKPRFKELLALLFSIFLSHFLVLGLFAYGIQMIASSEEVLAYTDMLSLVTPILIIFYGGYLLFKSSKKNHAYNCSCGSHHHQHAGEHHEIKTKESSVARASFIGFVTGLMPCPTAIAPILLAGVNDNFSSSFTHVLVYAIGLVCMLFLFLGLLMVLKSFFKKQFDQLGGKFNIQKISSILFIVIGIFYLISSLAEHQGHAH
jgi:ABC-type nickel/cobalt efflux system permease component RcnA